MANLKNTNVDDTGFLELPSGTTAQRPSSAVNGNMRFNSEFNVPEQYINGTWKYMPSIIETNLILRLDAAEPSSYPGNGSTWFDMSGNNNDASLFNGPTYNTNNGGSLNFNGSNEYASIDATNFDFSRQQTIFLVLQPEEDNSARRNPYAQSYGGYGTITHEPSGSFNYYHGTSGVNSSPYQGTGSGFTVDKNEIAVITLSRSPSEVKWYKNGIFRRSESNVYPSAESSVDTIELSDGYTNYYLGKIYCCLLYNKALTGIEIRQNFNALRGRYGL